MAEQAQAEQLPSQLPAPPPFYQTFTADNISRLREHRAQQGLPAQSTSDAQLGHDLSQDDVPQELRLFVPPQPPLSDEYSSFSEAHQLLAPRAPSLAEYGAEQLLSQDERSNHSIPSQLAPDFVRFIRSIMLNFLELSNVLASNPSQALEKVEDLRVLFLNAHQLLNQHRPHQARETLLQMMRDRISDLKKHVEDVKSMQDRVDELLNNIGNVAEDQLRASSDTASQQEQQSQERRLSHARRVWQLLNAIELG